MLIYKLDFFMIHCQVLVHNDMLEIPSGNILKRWTVTVGASIPTPNEGVRPVAPVSDADAFMHDALWLAARKLVEKGKENWSAFDTAMTILEKGGNDVEEVARKTKLSTICPGQGSNCHRNDNFIEVFQNNIKLAALPNSLACPDRPIQSGAPSSSSLKSWKAKCKKKVNTPKHASCDHAVAEVDEDSPSIKTKRLDQLGRNNTTTKY
jgi:hypothetical protein